jgi:hypothetical protein
MTDMFLERRFDPSIDKDAVLQMAINGLDCFGMHKVEWHSSFLGVSGDRMVCWFSAADMESGRIALRQLDTDMEVFWRGNVINGIGIEEADLLKANVIVERSFEEPVTLQEIQDIEDAGISCLDMRNVRFIQTFFSADQKRMICLYEAPDAESVRQAQREAGVPFNDVWSFRRVSPGDLQA